MKIPTEQPTKSRGERVLASLRKPKLRLVRIPAGVLLVLGGIVGFLPLVGFWMVLLGLAVLAIDFPIADRLLRKLRNLSGKLRRFYLRREDVPIEQISITDSALIGADASRRRHCAELVLARQWLAQSER